MRICGNGILGKATAEPIKYRFPGTKVVECNKVENLSARATIYLAKKAGII